MMSPRCDDEDDDEKKKMPEMPDPLTEKFLKTRQIILSGEINKDLADKVVRQLLVLEATGDKKTIYMYIDSPGGDVDAGFAIFDMIRFIKAPAALVLLAVPKDRRVGLPNSHYLIHQPMSGMKGVATDIEIHAKELAKTHAKLNRIIAEETGTSEEQVAKDTDRDHWLDADEAEQYGLISRVVKTREEIVKVDSGAK